MTPNRKGPTKVASKNKYIYHLCVIFACKYDWIQEKYMKIHLLFDTLPFGNL